MRPIALHGHERSVTHIKYNRDGDLLFSSAKDNCPSVWYSINGERLGTYKGHGGAVWCIDVDWTTSKVITGSADNSLRMWDTETGTQLGKYDTRSAVRTCAFSYCGNRIMFSTDKQMGHACEIFFCDIRDSAQMGHNSSYLSIPVDGPKVTSAIWGPLDYYIIAGHENGTVCQWDSKSGQRLLNVEGHTKAVNDIQPYHDTTMFVTASKDNTAKLFDSDSLEHLKTYKTERPVNSASLSSLKHHVAQRVAMSCKKAAGMRVPPGGRFALNEVVLGGGQEAMDVTTTSTRIGKFDARFFHMVFEEEIGRVKGHFGPINSVAFHPDGKSYSSGGEDGYVRLHQFDPSYFEYEFEY